MKNNNLLKNIGKLSLFALPICASGLVNTISNFAAIFMVAKLGKLELAAAAIAVSTFITMTTVVMVFYSIGILISHYQGQQKTPEEIGVLTKNGIWLAILLAAPFCVFLWNMDHLLILFGQDLQLVLLAKNYFHFAALSMFPLLIGMVITQFFSATGFPRYSLIISLISLPTTIFLSNIFIFGKLGQPSMGLGGVSCATLIVQTTLCFFSLWYLRLGKNLKKYRIFKNFIYPDWQICKRIFSLGFPIGVQYCGELTALTIATYLMGKFGVISLAASQIISQYSLFIVMVTLGLSQALSILVSEAYGKEDFELLKQYVFAAVVILSGLFVFIFSIIFFESKFLIRIFILKNDYYNFALINLAQIFFYISAMTLFVDGLRNIFSAGLRGMQDSQSSMRIGIFCLWIIALPVSYLVGFTFHGGAIGLRIGFMSGFVIAVFWLWSRLNPMILSKQLSF